MSLDATLAETENLKVMYGIFVISTAKTLWRHLSRDI